MGKLSRDKGKRGEREVVALLRKHGFEARRGQQFRGGSDSPDIIHNMEGFYIEVKLRQNLNLYDTIDVAMTEKKSHEDVLVFHRKNARPWLITMDAGDFLELMEEFYELRSRP